MRCPTLGAVGGLTTRPSPDSFSFVVLLVDSFQARRRHEFPPLRGTALTLLQSLRRSRNFRGSVVRLAELTGASEASLWRALVVLDTRRLVIAANDGPGSVWVSVTKAGLSLRN